VRFYDTLEDFLPRRGAGIQSTAWASHGEAARRPFAVRSVPPEQLPLVARLVNELELNLNATATSGHGRVGRERQRSGAEHPLGFQRADMELCFNAYRARPADGRRGNPAFPGVNPKAYVERWRHARCVVMQGGQGEVKALGPFNDPPEAGGKVTGQPLRRRKFRKLGTRVVDLHPITLIQNARTSGGGVVQNVPSQAIRVGPRETWKAEKVSIWQAGGHDNPFGMRPDDLYDLAQNSGTRRWPMSLLADHPKRAVQLFRHGLGSCEAEMH